MTDDISIYVVGVNQSIKEALTTITHNLSRCAIVTRDNDIVVGVVSEGDVIRMLLDDISLYTPIGKVIKPSFRYLTKNDMLAALRLLQNIGITLVPIVDETYQLKDVITIHQVLKYFLQKLGDDTTT